MSFTSRCGTGEVRNTDTFKLKCSVCDRPYIMVVLMPHSGIVEWKAAMPILPCHADSLIVENEDAKGFDRVVQLLTEGQRETKVEKFSYTLHMDDGMIVGFSVMRG